MGVYVKINFEAGRIKMFCHKNRKCLGAQFAVSAGNQHRMLNLVSKCMFLGLLILIIDALSDLVMCKNHNLWYNESNEHFKQIILAMFCRIMS